MTITDRIDEQLRAYNHRDLEGFVNCYHPEVEGMMQLTGETLFRGIEALRTRYRKRFETPDLHADILNRIVLGDKLIDHERIWGVEPDAYKEAVVTYQLEAGLIRRVWFMYP